MRFFYLLLLFFLTKSLIQAQNSKEHNSFELKVITSEERISSGELLIMYTDSQNKEVIDSVKIVNNQSIFKGKIDSPTEATILDKSSASLTRLKSSIIYLEPAKMKISLDFKDFRSLKMQGSKTQEEYQSLQDLKLKIYDRRDSVSCFYKLYNADLKNTNDIILLNELHKNINKLDSISQVNTANEIKIELDFLDNNPASFVNLHLLKLRLKRKEISSEIISSKFESLSNNVKSSAAGIKLKELLQRNKNIDIGATAPNFKVVDNNNQILELSSFKNQKYILLDFWASWCAPCREDFAFLKEIYSQYKSKDLEIINISRDENLMAWRNAILKDNIGMWRHFSTKLNNSNVEEIYAVTAIPVKVLINKEGKIAGMWKGSGSQVQFEINKLLSEFVNGNKN